MAWRLAKQPLIGLINLIGLIDLIGLTGLIGLINMIDLAVTAWQASPGRTYLKATDSAPAEHKERAPISGPGEL